MKVESETERNHWAHDHDHEINFCLRRQGAAVGGDVQSQLSVSCRMSDFVNYKKRSITLPPGCKDLVDVLRQGRNMEWLESRLGIDLSRAVTRNLDLKGTFQDIQKNVHQAVTASALMFILKILPVGQPFTFTLQRLYQQPFQATIEVKANTAQEDALRLALLAHKLRTPSSTFPPGLPFQDLPWRSTWPFEPLPPDSRRTRLCSRASYRNFCGSQAGLHRSQNSPSNIMNSLFPPDNSPESNRRPACPLGVPRQIKRAVRARASIFSGGN